MKLPSTILLVGSLALNATLAGMMVAERSGAAAAAKATASAIAIRPRRVDRPDHIDPKTWATLQTDDLSALTARLREGGFPKDVIRATLRAIISEQFAARRRALDPIDGQRPYWKDQSPDANINLARTRLYREQHQALSKILGPDARPDDPLSLARQRARLGNLPAEKLAAAQEIIEEHDQRRMEFYSANGTMNSEDLKRLESELRTALAGILAPAELEEYDFRNSSTGRTLRNELAIFAPSEDEYRAIFQLRKAFDDEYGWGSVIPTQEQMRRHSEAQKLMVDQIKLKLAPERGAEYERATNSEYRRTAQLVARLELPPATTVKLWNIQKEFSDRRAEIYRMNPSAAERAPLLAALQQEAVAKVTPLLGSASRVDSYKQYGGTWIGFLVPRPSPGR